MTTLTSRSLVTIGCLRTAGVVTIAVVVAAFGFDACGVVSKVKAAVHDIRGNKALIDSFSTKLQSGSPTAFDVTYVTTGSTPATIVYGVMPPSGLAFNDVPSGGTGDATPVHVVVNSSGEYACSQASGSGSTSQWTCEKLGTADAATQNKVFDFYTPAHWVAFLRDFALAAGFAGDKVTSSTMTVNGFSLRCVDFTATGVPGTSTICSTTEGILGYVKVASDPTSFEIQDFSTSPPASLFELPAGAKITTAPNGST